MLGFSFIPVYNETVNLETLQPLILIKRRARENKEQKAREINPFLWNSDWLRENEAFSRQFLVVLSFLLRKCVFPILSLTIDHL